MTINKKIIVGIADMKISRYEGELITYALGSCVGIALYDPFVKLGALVHIMLPQANATGVDNIFKFADTGIMETLRKMNAFGARNGRITAKIAGGAKMFEMQDNSALGNIGQRNSDEVKKILRREGIRLLAEDVGANYARTMTLDVSTGKVSIKSFGKKEVIF